MEPIISQTKNGWIVSTRPVEGKWYSFETTVGRVGEDEPWFEQRTTNKEDAEKAQQELYDAWSERKVNSPEEIQEIIYNESLEFG